MPTTVKRVSNGMAGQVFPSSGAACQLFPQTGEGNSVAPNYNNRISSGMIGNCRTRTVVAAKIALANAGAAPGNPIS